MEAIANDSLKNIWDTPENDVWDKLYAEAK